MLSGFSFFAGQKSLPLTYDPFFKYIFHPDRHADRLENFISSILGMQVKIRSILPVEDSLIDGETYLIMDLLVVFWSVLTYSGKSRILKTEKEIFQEIALLRRKPEEVISMWSEALRILDENSLKYYVEELKEELDKEKQRTQEMSTEYDAALKALHEKDAEIAALKEQLANK